LEGVVVGNGAIGRHTPGGDFDKCHDLGLELGRYGRVRMAQLFGHVGKDAAVTVHRPVRHRQRVYPDRTSAAENF